MRAECIFIAMMNIIPNDEETVMNTSYNYADFIGLNLDSDSAHHPDPHPLQEEKPGSRKPVIKTDQLPRSQTRQRLKQ